MNQHRISKTVRTIVWALRQIVIAAPFEAFFVALFVSIQEIAPGISVLVLGKIVSWLAHIREAGANGPPMYLMVLWSCSSSFSDHRAERRHSSGTGPPRAITAKFWRVCHSLLHD